MLHRTARVFVLFGAYSCTPLASASVKCTLSSSGGSLLYIQVKHSDGRSNRRLTTLTIKIKMDVEQVCP